MLLDFQEASKLLQAEPESGGKHLIIFRRTFQKLCVEDDFKTENNKTP